MIRITDMTLSCLDTFAPDTDTLLRLFRLIEQSGVEAIELSERAYCALRVGIADSVGKILVRLNKPENRANYPEVRRFVSCRGHKSKFPDVISLVQANDIRDINFLSQKG